MFLSCFELLKYSLNNHSDYFICCINVLQVSDYLMKQIVAVEGEPSDALQDMLKGNDKLVEEIFQHEDKDKNGFISHDEFSGPKHDEL